MPFADCLLLAAETVHGRCMIPLDSIAPGKERRCDSWLFLPRMVPLLAVRTTYCQDCLVFMDLHLAPNARLTHTFRLQ
jgi:hypothetical protein